MASNSSDNRKAPPKIIECSCKHEYQDKKFGKNKRFANACVKGWRYTVCSKIQEK